ncbi:MAG: hypothetical protein L6R41_003003 [Letrouitia leprolyta]|nr:MAG: hypothetical protein L6R41_003003 [Letrouitia leprolyta]
MFGITSPVKTCDINDKPLANGVTAQSGCNGGTSFMCSSQAPWAVNNNLAYGFAAVTASNPTCCSCYKLTFTSTSIKGKTMIVQATNTGNDVSGTQFDLAMPGGGFGQFDGCSKEWRATSSVWGAQYGGSNTNQCSKFPSALQKGCGFRWDWMQGQSNPTVNYEQVTCPAELVAKSGCSVSGYKAPSSVSTRSPAEDSSTVAATTEQQISSEQVSTSYAAAQTTGTTSVDTGNSETGAVTSAEVTPTGTVAPTGTSTAEGVVETGTTGAGGEAGQGEGEGEDDTCES